MLDTVPKHGTIIPGSPNSYAAVNRMLTAVETGDRGGYISTAQVAKALGLSVTTVKRWVDEEIIPAHRTAGGHRKLLMADVLRVVRDCNLPISDLGQLAGIPKLLFPAERCPIRNQLTAALKKGDAGLVKSLLHTAYRSGYPIHILADRAIAPAMRDIGIAGGEGCFDILCEHRATQALTLALYELDSVVSNRVDRARPVAVGGAAEGDHYLLPSLLARLTLADAGWSAVNIGPHTPFAVFREALEKYRPRLVWISASYLVDAGRFARDCADFAGDCRQAGTALIVGGSAITPEIADRLPPDTTGTRMADLAALAKSLHAPNRVPLRGRPKASVAIG